MTSITVISESTAAVDGQWSNDAAIVSAEGLEAALGWTLKPEGLCRADVCVPVHDRSALEVDGGLDLAHAASLLGRPVAVDAEAGLVAVGVPNTDRQAALKDRQAPDFTLPDLNGTPQRFHQWQGKKKLLVAFSSW